MIDMLTPKPGVEFSQTQKYFSKVAPVLTHHGLEKVHRLQVDAKLAGPLEPQIINIWSVRNAETMAGIQSDPDYQKNAPLRNATFDMPSAVMFMLTPMDS